MPFFILPASVLSVAKKVTSSISFFSWIPEFLVRVYYLLVVGVAFVVLLLLSCCWLSDDSDTNMTGPFVWESSGDCGRDCVD